jgi:hypothetical protein
MGKQVNIPKLRFPEFSGGWERIINPDFNSPVFEGIKNEARRNNNNIHLDSI